MEEDDEAVCRICLASERDAERRLIAPCSCSGTMKFVHRDCLRIWRTQGPWRSAEICPVCGDPYRSEWGHGPGRLLQRFPAASATVLGSLLFCACAPRLQRHLAGAVWVQVAAPLPGLDLWGLWEVQAGPAAALGSWALGGVVLLTGPALLDHLLAAARGGSTPAVRLGELVLFAENLRRLRFLLRLASVRMSLRSAEGLLALLQVQDAVNDVMEAAASEGIASYRKISDDLLATCFGFFGAGHRGRCATGLSSARQRCLHLSVAWPRHVYVYLKVLALQLGCRSNLQRWLPLLWHLANRDIGQIAVFTDLVLGGPFWSLSSSLVRMVFPDFDASSSQMQHAFCNLRDLLCSVIRGSRAVRIFALYMS